MNEGVPPEKERVTIILHSGSYDRAAYALTLALVALASDMEVHILLTYEGLKRFTKGRLTDIGEATAPDVRVNIERGLESGVIQPLETQLADAKKMGLKLYACPNAIAALNIQLSDVLDEIDDVIGVTAFLALARTAAINWYI